MSLQSAVADPAPFDLAGPGLQVEVTRAGQTLPIASVPNLQSGDQVAIRPDFPRQQSAQYLLVAAFLRGATNPPPEEWFHSLESWDPKQSAGLKLVVPEGAEQLTIFLAPKTGGALRTLVSAIRGTPGAFVRAAQDLNEASLERARYSVYLATLRQMNATNPEEIKKSSPLLTRSLGLKLNASCLEKMPDQQANCLLQGREALILSDGHSSSVVSALTEGAPADLALSLSVSSTAKYGYYTPYLSALMDAVRIFESLRTAQYQYIPALGVQEGKEISLLLNAPPRFNNPKSVLVTTLPTIQKSLPPPLRPVDPKSVYCSGKRDLTLPMEGAPLVFATSYAHGLTLRLKDQNGRQFETPLRAEAQKGGLTASLNALPAAGLGENMTGSLHGLWGFESFDGPEFRFDSPRPRQWLPNDEDMQKLVAGQNATLRLETDSAACVDSVTALNASGQSFKTEWKAIAPNRIELSLALAKAKPGPFKLLIRQFGGKEPDAVALNAYAPAGRLDSFVFHVGDTEAVLKGARLEEVQAAALKNARFQPSAPPEDGELKLALVDASAAAALKAGDTLRTEITLRDGRRLPLETTVAAPRPAADLLARSILPAPSSDPIRIRLTDENEVPGGAVLNFSLRARTPEEFRGDEKVEVSAEQGGAVATLAENNGLMMADAHILLATLDTSKSFSPSAAGQLRYRLLKDGVAGSWLPLARLVRLPSLRELSCDAAATNCTLSGHNLFLIDAIAADAAFTDPVLLPAGFPGFTVATPRPAKERLYVKLHDDPAVVNEIELPVKSHAPAAKPAPAAPSLPETPAATTPAPASNTAPETAPAK